MTNIIKPELSGGFRDYLPEEMIPRNKIIEIVEKTFQKFGFLPLDTPGLEKEEIITGGDENFKKQIYRASTNNSNDKLVLRFDLTVPLARVVASSLDKITFPFKRYQIGKVWRGERQQAGRFKEFVQFDADIVGTKSIMADSEIVALIYETMKNLGFNNFLIQVNNRKILNSLPEYVGYDLSKNTEVIRILDKLDKIGWSDVEKLLTDQRDDEQDGGVGLNKNQIDLIKEVISLEGKNQQDILAKAKKILSGSKIALEGIKELEEMVKNLTALNVPDNKWVIDLSLARGLGYYTGPVFETILTDMTQLGSVFSGGRYDDLVNRFMTNSIPATGASVGIDRLFVGMKELGLVKSQNVISKVLALNIDPTTENKIQEVITQIRKNDIEAEIYFGSEKGIKGQLAYAIKNEYPIVIIIGSDELKEGTVQIKNLKTREQFQIKESEVVAKIKSIL